MLNLPFSLLDPSLPFRHKCKTKFILESFQSLHRKYGNNCCLNINWSKVKKQHVNPDLVIPLHAQIYSFGALVRYKVIETIAEELFPEADFVNLSLCTVSTFKNI